MKKFLAFGIILLLVGMSIPSTGLVLEKLTYSFENRGDVLYVGGSGVGNYTKIQDAIDNASDGDTVYVYNGTYYENVVVDKSIDLIGEDKNTTIINGSGYYEIVNIYADWVNISGFTVLGSFIVEANYTIISNNIIKSHWECILIGSYTANLSCYKNTIMNNVLMSDETCIIIWNSTLTIISGNIINPGGIGLGGILLTFTDDSVVSENIIKGGQFSIFLSICSNNTITKNTISNCSYGVYLFGYQDYYCYFNTISKNNINARNFSIFLDLASMNNIFENNFYGKPLSAYFRGSQNKWSRNYWNRPRLLPKLIFGITKIGSKWVPWVNIDWRPAIKPYDTGV